MAKVTDPTGAGDQAHTFIIKKDGTVTRYKETHQKPSDLQKQYRLLMIALNHVLKLFSDPVDADVKAIVALPAFWSGDTFGLWAANFGTAIDLDKSQFGRSVRCS